MRLTLRTMLAYLDDILEPTDAEVLAAKIEESEFASGLVHRIRSSTGHLRLTAPKLEGKGMGLDPNTVAEYLDNTLSQDRVPDFEKVCLESDVHLAEVASCHQILTLVLGEAADVDPALRERIYRIHAPLGARPGAAVAGSTATAPLAGQPAEPKEKRKLEVPDYLRTRSAIRWKPVAMTLAVAFVLMALALLAMGPLDRGHPLFSMLWGEPSEQATSRSVGDDTAPQPLASDAEAVPDSAPEPSAPDAGEPSSGEPAATPPQPQQPSQPVGASPDAAPSSPPPAASDPSQPGPPAASAPSQPGPPASPPSSAPATDTPPSALPEEPPGTPAGQATQVAGDVGRYITDDQVLARLDVESGNWMRSPARTVLHSGDQLLALPTYRPQISMTSGVQLMLVGASLVRLHAPDELGAPYVSIHYGRALVDTVGSPGARIHLDLAGRRGTVSFGDVESALALEVRRVLPLGSHPEETAAQVVIQILATSGQIQWEESGADAVVITAGQMHLCLGEQAGKTLPAGTFPDWIEAKDVRDIDRRASRGLEPLVALERPLSLSLQEQTEHRQVELRALAIRSLGYVDEFAPFVAALNDEWQHSYWGYHFDVLREALARSPETAALVRVALEKQRGDDAADLYRLLWGYTPEQLAQEAAAKLVQSLVHQEMDIRVLAYENLRRITGKTHRFRPEKDPQQQKRAILDWQEDLKNGAVTYTRAATPTAPREAAERGAAPPAASRSPETDLP